MKFLVTERISQGFASPVRVRLAKSKEMVSWFLSMDGRKLPWERGWDRPHKHSEEGQCEGQSQVCLPCLKQFSWLLAAVCPLLGGSCVSISYRSTGITVSIVFVCGLEI